MKPDELIGTISITSADQHDEIAALVEELRIDLDRESAVASSCARLLARSEGGAGFESRQQYERMGDAARRRCDALRRYIDWGKSLLEQSSARE